MGKKTNEKITSLDQKSYSIITEIEEKYPVYDLEFKDKSKVWNPLRIYLYFYIIESDLRKKELFYKKIINMFIEGLKPIKIPKNHNQICAFSSGRNRRQRNDTYYDIMMDPISELIEQQITIFEWPGPDGKHRSYDKPIFSKHLTKINLSLYTKEFWTILLKRIKSKNKLELSSNTLFIKILTHYANETKTDPNKLIKDTTNYLILIPILKTFFREFIKKITPKIVIMVGAHSGFNMALIQACKEQKIPTIELQHGLITKYHAAYIKTKQTSNYDYRPDFIFTYGTYFTEMMKKSNAFPSNQIITIGYPYLNKIKKIPPTTSTNLQNHLNTYNKNILITSQWNIADEIITFTTSLSDKLQKSNKNIGILFKPHPSDWRDYPSIINKSNIYIAGKYDDTYELFKISDIHSTVYSTSGLEALTFSKPNIFIDIGKTSISDIFDIIDNNTCFQVKTVKTYITILNQILDEYKRISNDAFQKSIQYFNPETEIILKKTLLKLQQNKTNS